MSPPIIRLAGILGAMGVGAGAYGAHALEAGWENGTYLMVQIITTMLPCNAGSRYGRRDGS